jgi:spore coat protein H
MRKNLGFLLVLGLILSACGVPVTEPDNKKVTLNGVTATQAYFDFFDASIYHEIVIEITKDEITHLDNYMKQAFAKYGHYRISSYVKANFVYREDGKEKIRIDEVGLRTHGNIYSRYLIEYDGSTMNSQHYRISFDETFDLKEGSSAYAQRKKRELYGLENLVIKWNKTSSWSAGQVDPYILESYGYSLYEKAGVPASKATLVHVVFSIDGKEIDQGVMTMIEPVDDQFIQKRFDKNSQNGNLYKALWQNAQADLQSTQANLFGIKSEEDNYFPAYDIKTNDETNKADDLKDLIRMITVEDGQNFTDAIKTELDTDNFIRFNAMNYLYGNPDDFRYNSNNYYLYHDSSNKPQWFFIPTDLDKGLGITDWNPDGQEMRSVLPLDPFTSNFTFPVPLIFRKTILNEESEFKDQYLQELNDQVDKVFDYNDFVKAYQVAYALYAQDVSKTETRTIMKPFGIPDNVTKFYCVQTYKVINLKQPTTECD